MFLRVNILNIFRHFCFIVMCLRFYPWGTNPGVLAQVPLHDHVFICLRIFFSSKIKLLIIVLAGNKSKFWIIGLYDYII